MSSGDKAAMPVVKKVSDRKPDDRTKFFHYVQVDHLYQGHNGGYYLYHPADEPWEVATGNTSSEPLTMDLKQARSLRDQLNTMDLDDPKEN